MAKIKLVLILIFSEAQPVLLKDSANLFTGSYSDIITNTKRKNMLILLIYNIYIVAHF